MKKKGTGREILKIILASGVLVVLTYMCVKTGIFPGVGSLIDISFDTILKIIIAVAFIQVVGGVLIVALSLFKSKSGRVGTMSTVLISIIKYSMRIIGFCWVLTIIGVNVSTIFASIGILALIIGFGAESLVADIVTGVFVLFEKIFLIFFNFFLKRKKTADKRRTLQIIEILSSIGGLSYTSGLTVRKELFILWLYIVSVSDRP